jgi:hypothetical protein
LRLPNGAFAIVEIAKLRDYCLNQSHPRGRHKARVFASALSITSTHAEELRHALLLAAQEGEASIGASNDYGTRYIIDFEVKREEKSAMVRSIWIIETHAIPPRFVTCYVLLSPR